MRSRLSSSTSSSSKDNARRDTRRSKERDGERWHQRSSAVSSSYNYRRPRVSYADLEEERIYNATSSRRSEVDRHRRPPRKSRSRSRSPRRRREEPERHRDGHSSRSYDSRSERRAAGDGIDRDGHRRRDLKASVSERASSLVPTDVPKSQAETFLPAKVQPGALDGSTEETLRWVVTNTSDPLTELIKGMSSESAPQDPEVLKEERRRRREAIIARHKALVNSPLVEEVRKDSGAQQALTSSERSREGSADGAMDIGSATQGMSPQPPTEADDVFGTSNPVDLSRGKDAKLSDSTDQALRSREESPLAADYDPVQDMEADDRRHNLAAAQEPSDIIAVDHHEPIPDSQTNASHATNDRIAVPRQTDHETEFDMFAAVDFTVEPIKPPAPEPKLILPPPTNDLTMLDNWDDDQGYYKVVLGELLAGRYSVQANLGKGMFSGVVRALDNVTQRLVAIKIVRRNDAMARAGEQEIAILVKLNEADPDNLRHIIRLEGDFRHKGHLCMVFEHLSMNLREALKKFGKDVGINLRVVRIYARQMFMGLNLLRKCEIIHADIKPDNILINEQRSTLKICDLGSASATDEEQSKPTAYLVSRFYRAPEIILGLRYDEAIDMWSMGCTLYELFTGRILFTGRTNNQMLRVIMECQGKIPNKMLRKAPFTQNHFDDMLVFRSVEKDKMTLKEMVRMLPMNKPITDLRSRLMGDPKSMPIEEAKEIPLFIDLLNRCLEINPEKRISPKEALNHPFINRAKA